MGFGLIWNPTDEEIASGLTAKNFCENLNNLNETLSKNNNMYGFHVNIIEKLKYNTSKTRM